MLTPEEAAHVATTIRPYVNTARGQRPATTQQLLSGVLARINNMQREILELTKAAHALAVVYKQEKETK
jgi:hypothetical protein